MSKFVTWHFIFNQNCLRNSQIQRQTDAPPPLPQKDAPPHLPQKVLTSLSNKQLWITNCSLHPLKIRSHSVLIQSTPIVMVAMDWNTMRNRSTKVYVFVCLFKSSHVTYCLNCGWALVSTVCSLKSHLIQFSNYFSFTLSNFSIFNTKVG